MTEDIMTQRLLAVMALRPGAQFSMNNETGSVEFLDSTVPPTEAEIVAAMADSWRPQAMVDLRARRDRLLDVISGMQADYIAAGDMPSALLCRTVKLQLKSLPSDPSLTAATTRDQFNAVAVALWKTIASAASPEVRAEFARYATAA